VLPDSSQGVPADRAAAAADHSSATAHHPPTAADLAASAANRSSEARRPIQLRRWFRELAGWMVCPEEGMVLQGSWEGLPQPGRRWMYDIVRAIRLQCRVRKLDARLVGG